MILDQGTSTVIIAVVSGGFGLLTAKLKGTNSNEKVYADHAKELSETVEKLLKERQAWQDERLELKAELNDLHRQIEELTKEVKTLNGEYK